MRNGGERERERERLREHQKVGVEERKRGRVRDIAFEYSRPVHLQGPATLIFPF